MARRFAEIRQKKGLTQAEYAEALEIGRSTVTNLERGTNLLTDRNIKMVCLAYNVNETWLRTGVGEMFVTTPEGPNTDSEKRLIDMFRRLVPEMQDIIIQKVWDMLKIIEESWVPPQAGEDKEKRAAGE